MAFAPRVGFVGEISPKLFSIHGEILHVVDDYFQQFFSDIPDTSDNSVFTELSAVGDPLMTSDTSDKEMVFSPYPFFPAAEAPLRGARIGGVLFENHPFRRAPEGRATPGENLCL